MTRRLDLLIGLALAVIVLGVFSGTLGNGFVFDDGQYLLQNPAVQKGLTADAARWAFKSMQDTANWHPLTWLSHLADVSLYGMKDPAGHHFTNILLHAANVVLLFLLLVRMTGSPWKSGFVAALFGLHPLRVESVAWIAERKDVLSTLFWLLTMWAYVRYAEFKAQGSRFKGGTYLSMIVLFALGLMSKPMLVTLPFVLFLLDYWPLARMTSGVGAKHLQTDISRSGGLPANALPSGLTRHSLLVMEKAPLLALSALSIIVTIIAQQKGGAVPTLGRFSMEARVTNAVLSYVEYIGKMIWPRNLAAFYMHGKTPLLSWQFIGALVVLAGITVAVALARRRRPYLIVGWLWFVGTLVPVIGLIQVGGQALADRYTYVPLVGLFVMAAWGIPELVVSACRTPRTSLTGLTSRNNILPLTAVVVLVALAVCTWPQIGYWRDEVSLFSRAIAATTNNSLAHLNLGRALAEQGKLDEAIPHYHAALRISPRYVIAHVNLGYALVAQGKIEQGRDHYLEALRLDPRCAEAHNNLGVALVRLGDLQGAIAEFREAVRLKPDYGPAGRNLRRALDLASKRPKAGGTADSYSMGVILAEQGRPDEALACFKQVVRLNPGHSKAWHDMGVVLSEQGHLDEAVYCYRRALEIEPGYASAYGDLAAALYLKGEFVGARREVELCRKHGGTPPSELVRALFEKTPR